MSLIDMFRIGSIKKELHEAREERDRLRGVLAESERLSLYEVKEAIKKSEQQLRDAERELAAAKTDHERTKEELSSQIAEIDKQITMKKGELVVLDEQLLLQSFGLYTPRYELQNSELYRAKLDEIRIRQTQLVKAGEAAHCPANWTVNGSAKEGERMIRDYTKLIVRSFNNECDASIVNVKFSNIESVEKKITKAFDTLNKLAQRMQIAVTREYLDLKLEELHLCYEYQIKKQHEKEEQRRVREQMREEAKLLKEIEEAKQKLEKEEHHFTRAIEAITLRLASTKTDAERSMLELEKSTLQDQLTEVSRQKLDVQFREQNTRAGYVYVISNVGSFGEGVYKIGVTRRLDPDERVDELGDASVPFRFDVHAMIFSDDAPALENALHKAFHNRRLNLINMRREFFSVRLDEIESEVTTNFGKPVEFTRLAEAAEYRQSIKLRDTTQPAESN